MRSQLQQAEQALHSAAQAVASAQDRLRVHISHMEQADSEIQELKLAMNASAGYGADAATAALEQEAAAVATALGQGDEEGLALHLFEQRKVQEWDQAAQLFAATCVEVECALKEKKRYDKSLRALDLEEEKFYWVERQSVVDEVNAEKAEFRQWEKSQTRKENERILRVLVAEENRRQKKKEDRDKVLKMKLQAYEQDRAKVELYQGTFDHMRQGCMMWRLTSSGIHSAHLVRVYLAITPSKSYVIQWESRHKSKRESRLFLYKTTRLYQDSSHGLFARKKNPFKSIPAELHAYAFSIVNDPRAAKDKCATSLDVVANSKAEFTLFCTFAELVGLMPPNRTKGMFQPKQAAQDNAA